MVRVEKEVMIVTAHRLDFEVASWECITNIDNDFSRFRIGTCEGLWRSTKTSYDILVIVNSCPGNGHLEDVMEWFKSSCYRDKKDFRILEVWNKEFKKHLISKRGFYSCGEDNVILKFKKCRK